MFCYNQLKYPKFLLITLLLLLTKKKGMAHQNLGKNTPKKKFNFDLKTLSLAKNRLNGSPKRN